MLRKLFKRAAIMVAVLSLACGGEGGTGPGDGGGGGGGGGGDAAAINQLVAALPSWSVQAPVAQPDATLPDVFITDTMAGGDILDYKCSATRRDLVRDYTKIMAAGADFDQLYPGALIQGGTLEGGQPAPLTLKRAPLTIRISLAIPDQSRTVTDVNSVTMAQAIADLKVAASQQGTIDPIPANMVFDAEEASSFTQSMTEMGIHAGYQTPFSGVSANIEGSLDRSVTTHSIVVKFVQEMYTIGVADDLLPTPADFLDPSVTAADLETQRANGDLGDSNLPVYVESVTYGRVFFFTLKSTSVSTASQLKAAMEASAGNYQGGASISNSQKQILNNSSARIVVYGGPQQAATEAIASLDWSKFFTPAAATQAVPIAYTVKTLKGKKTANIVDEAQYDERGGCNPAKSYTVTVTLKKVAQKNGFCLACAVLSYVSRGGLNISILRADVFGPTTGSKTYNDSRSQTLAPTQRFDICSEFDTGAACAPFGFPDGVSANPNNIGQIANGKTRSLNVNVNSIGAGATFTYEVKKVANF